MNKRARFFSYFFCYLAVFLSIKATLLLHSDASFGNIPWLITSDTIFCLALAAASLTWPRFVRFVASFLAFYYIFAAHYYLLFKSFPLSNIFLFIDGVEQLQDSILDSLKVSLLVLFPFTLLIIYRFRPPIENYIARHLEVTRNATLALLTLLLILRQRSPDLGLHSELRKTPIFAFSFDIADKTLTPSKSLQPESSRFSEISKFSTDIKQENIELRRGQNQDLNVIIVSLESTSAISMQRDDGLAVMPNLMALADDGLYFENVYAVVPLSIKSIFNWHSGFYPMPTLVPITQKYPRFPSKALPQFFKEKGYRTALLHAGKFSYTKKLNYLSDRGYDLLLDAETLPNRTNYETSKLGIDDLAMYDHAKAWIAEGDSPFLLSLITLMVHHPYHPPKHWKKRFEEKEKIDLYHNTLAYQDDLIGQLVSFLKRHQLYDNTIFVVFGDHGQAFGQHSNSMHTGQIYEENVKVPLVISNPKLFPRKQRVEKVGSLIDILPTVLDATGTPMKEYHGHGQSLLESRPGRMIFFFTELSAAHTGLRDGSFKYIHIAGKDKHLLFNLKKDPAEKNNLAKDHPERVEYYRQKTKEWRGFAAEAIENPPEELINMAKAPKIARLTSFPLQFASQGWGKLTYNRTVTGKIFSVAGKKYDTFGLGTHASSIHIFDVSKVQGATFSTLFGKDDSKGKRFPHTKVKPEIWLDGQVVFSGPLMKSSDQAIKIELPINGKELALVVKETSDSARADHVDWIEPVVIMPNSD